MRSLLFWLMKFSYLLPPDLRHDPVVVDLSCYHRGPEKLNAAPHIHARLPNRVIDCWYMIFCLGVFVCTILIKLELTRLTSAPTTWSEIWVASSKGGLGICIVSAIETLGCGSYKLDARSEMVVVYRPSVPTAGFSSTRSTSVSGLRCRWPCCQ